MLKQDSGGRILGLSTSIECPLVFLLSMFSNHVDACSSALFSVTLSLSHKLMAGVGDISSQYVVHEWKLAVEEC